MDLNALTPETGRLSDDPTDDAIIRDMIKDAKLYLRSYRWCPPIAQVLVGYAVPNVIAALLVRFSRPIQDKDEMLWVIVGDLPSAYLVIDQARDAAAAIRVYCDLMDEWIDSVKTGRVGDDCIYPVKAPRDSQHAEMLATRIRFIREKILPRIVTEDY